MKELFKLQNILESPRLYYAFQWLIGGINFRKIFVKNFVKPGSGDKILDIGCGSAYILNFMQDVEYVGFDSSESCIKLAKKQFPDRGTFIAKNVSSKTLEHEDYFDTVIAVGVLHHLDNDGVYALFKTAYKTLKKGGKLITADGCFTENQSLLEKFILSQDRGRFVRNLNGYKKLIPDNFSKINYYLKKDLFNIPYTLLIIEYEK